MRNYKILVTGPVGSGKSTGIRVVSDRVLETDERVSDGTIVRKSRTTVAMDYGTLRLSDNETVHLYGTPGQPRFKFMWDILSRDVAKDCLGVILLIDNARNYPYRDLKFFTDEFRHLMSRTRTVVGVTRSDVQDKPTLDVYHSWLEKLGLDYEVSYIDAREGGDVITLVEGILSPHCVFSDWPSLRSRWAAADALTGAGAQQGSEPGLPGGAHAPVGEPAADFALTPPVWRPAQAERAGPQPERTPTPGREAQPPVAHGGAGREGEAAKKAPTGGPVPPPAPVNAPAPARRVSALVVADPLSENIVMKEDIVQEVMGLRGVKGAALATSMGDIVESTIEDGQLLEFLGFLAGVVPPFEEAANLGKVSEVILKSPKDDVITMYIEEEQALGIVADSRTSVRILKQQIHDMLQWG